MPRKGHIQKRDVLADPVYKNKVVTKLINNIMLDGKKGVAQKIVYGAFEQVAEQTAGKDALEVFDEAMNNVMPELEVKARRIGGSTYQVPIEVRPDRRQALALRWLTTYSRARGEKDHERKTGKRDHGCCKQHWLIRKKKRRYAQDGRGKQSSSHITVGNSCATYFGKRRNWLWLEENIHLSVPEILVLWLISMPVRQHLQSVFCTIPV